MLRQKLGLILDLAGERIDLGVGRPLAVSPNSASVALQAAVHRVVELGIVVQHHATVDRIDCDVADAGNPREGVADLLRQREIALGRRNLQAHPVGDLVRYL